MRACNVSGIVFTHGSFAVKQEADIAMQYITKSHGPERFESREKQVENIH